MDFFHAIILGIVEGLTEFLPISSTGHMILASSFFGLGEDEFLKTFEISIQIGAILSIVFLYAKNVLKSFDLFKKLFIAFLPTAVIGFLFYKIIKTYLFNPTVVSLMLILGGVILIFLDKKVANATQKHTDIEHISYKNAFLIGLVQSVSIVPGVSRAAATIIGGIFNGLDKKQAMEFSFLLAVPTMLAATGYDLLKAPMDFTSHELALLFLGGGVAFVSAWMAVKFFLRFVENHGFAFFGYYRIILGAVFLLYFL